MNGERRTEHGERNTEHGESPAWGETMGNRMQARHERSLRLGSGGLTKAPHGARL